MITIHGQASNCSDSLYLFQNKEKTHSLLRKMILFTSRIHAIRPLGQPLALQERSSRRCDAVLEQNGFELKSYIRCRTANLPQALIDDPENWIDTGFTIRNYSTLSTRLDFT